MFRKLGVIFVAIAVVKIAHSLIKGVEVTATLEVDTEDGKKSIRKPDSMTVEKGKYLFGFWEGMPYGSKTDSYDDFKEFKNTIDKEIVIRHIEALDDWVSSAQSTDLFTGEKFNAGIYDDGDFTFPVDFLRYYKTYDIGIPPEYEAYLRKTLCSRKE